jgi:hypothetical protein
MPNSYWQVPRYEPGASRPDAYTPVAKQARGEPPSQQLDKRALSALHEAGHVIVTHDHR